MKKVILYVVVALVVLIAGAIGSLFLFFPAVGPSPELTVEVTPERVKRGEYLANSVSVCMDCHSTRDWTKFSGPLEPGSLGKGGEAFTKAMGFPGDYYAPNITPAGIGEWSDGDIYRALTAGVKKDGEPIFPVMPFHAYGKMDQEDIYSIIAYLRTLPSIENKVPASSSDFPFNLILRTLPAEGTPSPLPPATDTLAMGEYLFNAAACTDCHTPVDDKGAPLPGMYLAGGRAFPMPSGTVRSANLTSDKKTGIGTWTASQFVSRFKAYADSSYQPHTVAEGQFQTVMPWVMYASMTEADLTAMFRFLQTVPPVSQSVTRFDPVGQQTAGQ
ncbi:MAG: c-type cytochrome [Bacteroidetes bacterium]|nr:c-type cytochrome [Bacteroidota bacterium]